MKIKTLILILIFSVFTYIETLHAEVQWYVNVLGENQQLITGASVTPNITDGKFLDKKFKGKKFYVRVQEHYELDGFRQKTNTSASSSGSASASMAAEAASATEQKQLMTKFGPLTDSGLEMHVSGDFHGWYCSHLYVTPRGKREYELSCNDEMKFR